MSLEIAKKLKSLKYQAVILTSKGATLLENGKLPEALQFDFEALNISEKIKDTAYGNGYPYDFEIKGKQYFKAAALNAIGNVYMELGDYKKANDYYSRSGELVKQLGDSYEKFYLNEVFNIGNVYELRKMPDSALYFQQIVYEAALKNNNINKLLRAEFPKPELMFRMGNVYKLKGEREKALEFYKKGILESHVDNDIRNLTMNNLSLAGLYHEMRMPDSSMRYASDALHTGQAVSFKKGVYEACLLISDLYKNENKYDSAYRYLLKAGIERDSLFGANRFQELQRIILRQQELQQQLQEERDRINSRNKTIGFFVAFLLSVLLAFYLWDNNRKQKKVNTTLREQQSTIFSQNQVLEKTLKHLRSAQSQLIQSEKMASLGELTAGIAHEIQNPLNFVNNFSEVNVELLNELKEGPLQQLPEVDKKEADNIVENIVDNEQKIAHHGKRADSIVKSMLEHSRVSKGEKQPTDINALTDEYLRLSYQSIRSKDKSFNTTINTDFDTSISKINIIPQDIGRVLLNLLNNAFYAVQQKKLQFNGTYEPIIVVTTKKLDGKIEITVKDNGNGIPQKIVDKIFQPFFTTKPTGEGTGLGLSLSYDIIKAHGGELKVDSKEGEYAEFIIELPV